MLQSLTQPKIMVSPQTDSTLFLLYVLSVCPGLIFFCIFIFYVFTIVLSKGMSESFLLSEDKSLTPNID